MTTPSYSQTPNTGIAFDYSTYLERIATSLENLETSQTSIATSLETIASSVTGLTTSIDNLSNSSTSLKNSADSLVTPLTSIAQSVSVIANKDIIPLIDLYKTYVEQGKVLDHSNDVPQSVQSASLAEIQNYITKIRNI